MFVVNVGRIDSYQVEDHQHLDPQIPHGGWTLQMLQPRLLSFITVEVPQNDIRDPSVFVQETHPATYLLHLRT